ncbi:hypothetical protein PCC21_016230 [Pectobacterium carotovorum subsp. carotovorum PCC21]|nr:hypothetical protein PCC21_016230 [Pectobacterium carotovorum subsp. carotovorum PCC21]
MCAAQEIELKLNKMRHDAVNHIAYYAIAVQFRFSHFLSGNELTNHDFFAQILIDKKVDRFDRFSR